MTTLATLSPELKAQLFEELKREERENKLKREQDIEAFKGLQDEMVNQYLPELADFGAMQNKIVHSTIENFSALIKMKEDLYDIKEGGQDSHTFTARDGSGSITIGYNTIIAFDGTESAGVVMVKEYISGLSADDENREILADLLSTYLKPDKKGNLNPTRIVELSNKAAEINAPLLTKGMETIVKAQFKTRTSLFIRGWKLIKTEGKPDMKLQFRISAEQ